MPPNHFSRGYASRLAYELASKVVDTRKELRNVAAIDVGVKPVECATKEGLEALILWRDRYGEKKSLVARLKLVVEHYETLQQMLFDDHQVEMGMWASVYVNLLEESGPQQNKRQRIE